MARHRSASRRAGLSGGSGKAGTKGAAARPAPGSHRYTPPTPKTQSRSPLWVPVAMFTFLGCGLVVIVANYLGLLPGGEAQNSSLILGLILLVAGFVLSTRYR
jgi:hypothetical protein